MPDYLAMFQNLVGTEENIRFMNVYKGVPISYYGRAVESGANCVRFRVHANQILCTREEGYTFLYSSTIGKPVRALPLGMDMINEMVLLTSFEPVLHSIGGRSYIRVQPKDSVEAVISSQSLDDQETSVRAYLVDLSLRGAAIFVNLSALGAGKLSRGEDVRIAFCLPDETQTSREFRFNFNGTIRYISQTSKMKSVARIGIQTYPNKTEEQGLSRYIAQRQNDILKEIREKVQLEKRFPAG